MVFNRLVASRSDDNDISLLPPHRDRSVSFAFFVRDTVSFWNFWNSYAVEFWEVFGGFVLLLMLVCLDGR